MLPEGYLGPHPGLGEIRQSRYTKDEQRTEFTLWAISRSPMIFGGNLTKLDAFTRGLMTNREVLAINQKSEESHQLDLPSGWDKVRVWEARQELERRPKNMPEGHKGGSFIEVRYFAIFNLDDKSSPLQIGWEQLGLKGKQKATEIFSGNTDLSEGVHVTLPAHGSAVFSIRRRVDFK
jgi:hypothetical protein